MPIDNKNINDKNQHNVEIDQQSGVETTGHEWDGIKELNNPLPRWWLWIFYICIIWAFGYWVVYPAWPTISGNTKGIKGWTEYKKLEEEQGEINAIKKSFGPSSNMDSDRSKMIIYLNDLVASQIIKQKCYFYKIYDSKFDEKSYIYFTYDSKITIKNIIVHLDNKCINIKENNLKMDLLETCDVKTDIHSMLIADDYIDKYNSIENGYNKCYYFGDDY